MNATGTPADTLVRQGFAAQQQGDLTRARAAFEQALLQAPEHPDALQLPGSVLRRQGDAVTAEALLRRSLAVKAAQPNVWNNLGNLLLAAGRRDDALQACDQALGMAPRYADAHYNRARALHAAGDLPAAAESLNQALAASPQPTVGMLQLHAQIETDAGHLDSALKTVDQTLRGGTQTVRDIFEQGHRHVDLLKARIAEAVDDYIRQLPQDAAHPFLHRRAAGWRFADSWSSRLSRQGFHTDHVHPHGWISSACYVQMPPGVADAQARRGWIQFGRPDLPLPGVPADALMQRMEAPVPGRLVLFPSMLWHGTTAFDDDAVRMTIAFDVVPT